MVYFILPFHMFNVNKTAFLRKRPESAPQFKVYYNSRKQRLYSNNEGEIRGNKALFEIKIFELAKFHVVVSLLSRTNPMRLFFAVIFIK